MTTLKPLLTLVKGGTINKGETFWEDFQKLLDSQGLFIPQDLGNITKIAEEEANVQLKQGQDNPMSLMPTIFTINQVLELLLQDDKTNVRDEIISSEDSFLRFLNSQLVLEEGDYWRLKSPEIMQSYGLMMEKLKNLHQS